MASSLRVLAGSLLLLAAGVLAQTDLYSALGEANASLFQTSMNAAGISTQVASLNNATLFAPTDAAWRTFLSELQISATDLPLLGTQLSPLIRYHVLPNNKLLSGAIPNGTSTYRTLLTGRSLTLSKTASTGAIVVRALASNATVTRADVTAGSSVIHIINSVLLPFYKNIAHAAGLTPSLSTLLAAVEAANLTTTLSDPTLRVTVFAPTNRVLSFSYARPINARTWLSGRNLTFARSSGRVKVVRVSSFGGIEAKVTTADVPIGPGPRSVVHVIDAVLIPFPTTVAVAARNAGLSTLLAAVAASDPAFLATLTDPKAKVTVLAPTEAAFAKLLDRFKLTAEQLLADKANLKAILAAHVIPGVAAKAADLRNGQTLITLGGGPLTVVKQGSSVTFTAAKSQAKVVVADVAVNLGTAQVHVIDDVLLPAEVTLKEPSAAPPSVYAALSANGLTVLKAAVDAAGLASTLNSTALDATLFAPNDEAFTELAASLNTTARGLLGLGSGLVPILTYHVLGRVVPASAVPTTPTAVQTLLSGSSLTVVRGPGGEVKVSSVGSDALVVRADLPGGRSVVHVIDRVLLPFFTSVAAAASRTPALSTLLAAVEAAGLTATLSNPDLAVTVFAPTNDGFNATLTSLGISASALLANPTVLGEILRYHVVPRVVPSSAITTTIGAPTLLDGKSLTVAPGGGGGVKVSSVGGIDAKVVIPDVPIGPGPRSVVHVIDAVLIPFPTTVAVAARNAGLSTLLAAVAASDPAFLATLTDPKAKVTVLAPTEAAFAKLLDRFKLTAEQLLADKANLKAILAAHVIPGVAAKAADLRNGQTLITLGGAPLTVVKQGSSVTFTAAKSQAKVVVADVAVNLGTAQVHVIDDVLLPAEVTLKEPSAAPSSVYAALSANGLTVLKAAVDAAGLASTLNSTALDATLFAPNDEAFSELAASLNTTARGLLGLGSGLVPILTYHVLGRVVPASAVPTTPTAVQTLLSGSSLTVVRGPGGEVKVSSVGSDALVVRADLPGGRSVVHVIDRVLLPFFTSVAAAASRTPALSTLLAAVEAAGLTATLSNPDLAVTVFAPTNDGFNATLTSLGISASALLANPTVLGEILRYHVVPRVVPSSAITTTIGAPTLLDGKSLTVAPGGGGGVKVSSVGGIDAKVVIPDVPIGPGPRSVVHVIDAVLIPFPTTVAVAARNAGLSTLLAAVAASDPAFLATLTDPKAKVTVLAPTEAAFAKLLDRFKLTAEQLLADKANLKAILAAHVIPGVAAKAADLRNGQTLISLGGAPLTVVKQGSSVTFTAAKSQAKVVVADVAVNLGTAQVHVIDDVLLPAEVTLKEPSAAPSSVYAALSANGLTVLKAAVDAAGLASTLNSTALDATLFAPNDEAFTELAASLNTTARGLLGLGSGLVPILTYHVLGRVVPASAVPTTPTAVQTLLSGSSLTVVRGPGGEVKVSSVGSDALVVRADLPGGRSVVHVIDRVLLPFFTSVAAAASRTPALSTLLAAVEAAGLTATLSNPDLAVTVFAPTNDGFNATLTSLGISASALLANPTVLGEILRYHVVPRVVPSSAITTTIGAPTLLDGKSLTVAPGGGGGVKVSSVGGIDAKVVIPDVPIGPGPRSVVHVIDAVLIPFPTTVAVAARNTGLSTLLAAVAASDPAFLATLTDPKAKVTVLAPTEAAFAKLLDRFKLTAEQLLADKANLKAILAAHVIPGVAAKAADLRNGQTLITLGGAPLTVVKQGSSVTFTAAKSQAKVVVADVAVNLGTAQVHVIDDVLLPAEVTLKEPSAAPSSVYAALSANGLTVLKAAVDAAGLASTLNSTALDATLFAPNDEAFTELAASLNTTARGLLGLGSGLVPILTYHVLGRVVPASAVPTTPTAVQTLLSGSSLTVVRGPGGEVKVSSVGSDALVVRADLPGGRSVVHVIDRVLLPFFTSVAAAASRTPALSTLLAAVEAAGLTATLSNPDLAVTVFAPTNDGFNATLTSLGISASALLANPTVLGEILRYHVVPRVVPSSAITTTIGAPTLLDGKSLTVAPGGGGGVKVSSVGGIDAKVVIPDVPIGPGPRSVVHVIDAVLIPFPTTVAVAARNAGLSTLLAAVAASDPAFLATLTDPKAKVTVLAPTEAAFAKLLDRFKLTAEQLLADKANLKAILAAHVIPGVAAKAADLRNGQTLISLGGAPLTVVKRRSSVTFTAAKSQAKVVVADVAVNLGTAQVHVIDDVLLPAEVTLKEPSAAPPSVYAALSANGLTVLKAAVDAAGLASTLNSTALDATLFAPNDEAFTELAASLNTTARGLLGLGSGLVPILTYHVLGRVVPASAVPTTPTAVQTLLSGSSLTVVRGPGGEVKVSSVGSDALVVRADLPGGRSVVHVINRVLLPFFTSVAAAASRTPALSTLLAAVKAAGLTNALSDPNLTVTVFAPTNDAFNATLTALGISPSVLFANPSVLADILRYHVVPQRVLSTDIHGTTHVSTYLSKRNLAVSTGPSGGVKVAAVGGIDANVIIPDVPIGLGPRSVVHVIDAVLIPFPTTVAVAARNAGLSTLLAAVAASDPAFLATLTDPKAKVTVLAPTNDAFNRLLKHYSMTQEQLLADKDNLRRVLAAHVIPGAALRFSDLSHGQRLTTLYGAPLTVSKTSWSLHFSAAKSTAAVLTANVAVNLGTCQVHVINSVLLPADVTYGSAA
ncbi:hypothetical protein HYH03_013169 [Edaphochlamys debaryana]|uniref:FAS1 domain-containing protein n=1 Tax=Edaphochlamys debaryana TaxID=47281 RepID=A0A836BUU4_9CHLO|nr:hypothetical protein HYH03_013169 [Edaphochlamys debaryana]|eukprot:KAG2488319.1 hypothetical protein HYH03_013169 [Edaphochlamys debaryana]